jgi:hypothetical protein
MEQEHGTFKVDLLVPPAKAARNAAKAVGSCQIFGPTPRGGAKIG